MELLSPLGIGLFTSWLPGVALWLLITFGVPQVLVLIKEKLPKTKQEKFDKTFGTFAVWWVAILLFGPPLVLFYLLFGRK